MAQNIAEKFNPLSRVHQRIGQTDDRRAERDVLRYVRL